jgi:hypothetical protein
MTTIENKKIINTWDSDESDKIIFDDSSVKEGNMDELDELSEDQKLRNEQIQSLIDAPELDTATAMNIIFNAIQVSFDKPHFNDLDRYLISKSLSTFKGIADKGEDIIVKTA